ncbi:MAG TPA: acetamidase/formamidase family protein [Terriglobales bacterium]|nr:acetamidase/formamidase family protein [Terriglobales bacterium]
MRTRVLLALLLLNGTAVIAADAGAPAESRVVRYEAKENELKFVYGVALPVARLRSGDVLETNTFDALGNSVNKPGDQPDPSKGPNPLTGPFYVEGAEPGDALAVRILSVEVDRDQGIGEMGPGFGALNTSFYTPMLNPDLPARIYFYPIDRKSGMATFRAQDSDFAVQIPMHPFLGCIGVAPPMGEARASITPGEWGGNMDAPEISAGHTLYLPVNVAGALLYVGDGHAAQGDGEVAGTGIEIPMRVRLQVEVIKGRRLKWPRLENDGSIMAVGAYRPLDDALRIAFTELIDWIHADYGLSRLDAYELLSKVAQIRLSEMVDPNYVVIAKIPKKYLPAKKK